MRVVRVYYTTPEPTAHRCEAFQDVVEEANELKARAHGVAFKAVVPSTSLLGRLRPKVLQDRGARSADLIVAPLWKGWEPGAAERFEEDVQIAQTTGTPFWCYVHTLDDAELAVPGDALRRILDFRDHLEHEGSVPTYLFSGEDGWHDLLMGHLFRWLDRLPTDMPPGVVDPGDLAIRLASLADGLPPTVTARLRTAWSFAAEGRRTRAAEHFARLLAERPAAPVVLEYARFLAVAGALERADALLASVGDVCYRQAASLHGLLGSAYEAQGDLALARQHFTASLTINEALDNHEGLAADYGSLGNLWWMQGELDKAEAAYRASLQINERLGNTEGQAADHSNLGNVYGVWGRLDEAEHMYRTALAMNERIGRRGNMANQYGNLGILYRVQGRLDAAEAAYRRSMAINEALGEKARLAEDMSNLGNVFQERGELDAAEAMYRRALDISLALGHQEEVASQYGNLGVILQSRGVFEEAEAMYRRALAIFESLGDFMPVEQVKAWISDLEEAHRCAAG